MKRLPALAIALAAEVIKVLLAVFDAPKMGTFAVVVRSRAYGRHRPMSR